MKIETILLLVVVVLVANDSVVMVGSQLVKKGKKQTKPKGKAKKQDKAFQTKKNLKKTKENNGINHTKAIFSNQNSKLQPSNLAKNATTISHQQTMDPQKLQEQQRRIQEARLLEQQQQQQQQEDQIAAAKAAKNEQVRLQREKAFEVELARMTLEQQKAAQRQKKRDARVVRRVLRAYQQQDWYRVLGLRRQWQQLTLPAMTLRIFQKTLWKVGPFPLVTISSKDITRAYRSRAVQVHPDKNRDGRAEEAFVAVNQVATILLDADLRKAYDQEQAQIRTLRRQEHLQILHQVTSRMVQVVTQTTGAMRKLLGPFFMPFVILGALLV
jgi:hypothetical protein